MTNKEYIRNLAVFLNHNGTEMSGAELAGHLNRNGFVTGYGEKYKGKRGTYTLLDATYEWLKKEGNLEEAGMVATSFVKPDGSKAYE